MTHCQSQDRLLDDVNDGEDRQDDADDVDDGTHVFPDFDTLRGVIL